jgi:PIN domain nuclease of toxin-antitoxin system
MRLLLDTHALLWWLFKLPQLGRAARTVIAAVENEVFVSAVSGYEITYKRALGKLAAPDDLESQVTALGFSGLPVTLRHAVVAGDLAQHHKDPFDRLLIAQAQTEGLTIVTSDRQVGAYDVPILPATE